MVPDAFQMLPEAPRCPPDAAKCFQMLPDASRCLPDASRCSPMLPDASQMPPDVPRCFQMFPRCLQMLPDASQMPPDASRSSQMLSRCLPDASRCLLSVFLKKLLFGVLRLSHIYIYIVILQFGPLDHVVYRIMFHFHSCIFLAPPLGFFGTVFGC